jgi:hypothetical protein
MFPLPECNDCPIVDECQEVKDYQQKNKTLVTTKKEKSVITVENEFDVETGKSLTEVNPGVAFIGAVKDINEDVQTGLFLRTADGVVLVDDPAVEFETFSVDEDPSYAPRVEGFKLADITVTVDDIY